MENHRCLESNVTQIFCSRGKLKSKKLPHAFADIEDHMVEKCSMHGGILDRKPKGKVPLKRLAFKGLIWIQLPHKFILNSEDLKQVLHNVGEVLIRKYH